MVSASQRDVLVIIQRDIGGESASGEPVPQWQEVARGYAQERFGSSADRRLAAGQSAQQAVTYRVLQGPKMNAVRLEDRLIARGQSWRIMGAVPIGRQDIEFSCTRETGVAGADV